MFKSQSQPFQLSCSSDFKLTSQENKLLKRYISLVDVVLAELEGKQRGKNSLTTLFLSASTIVVAQKKTFCAAKPGVLGTKGVHGSGLDRWSWISKGLTLKDACCRLLSEQQCIKLFKLTNCGTWQHQTVLLVLGKTFIHAVFWNLRICTELVLILRNFTTVNNFPWKSKFTPFNE